MRMKNIFRRAANDRPECSRTGASKVMLAGVALFATALSGPVCFAQAAAPAVFYSDLQSGPNTGGEGNNGVYVTVYGKRFGASQGSSFVTVGGGKAVNYKTWSDTKVTFQLGPSAVSGPIQVTTSNGASNGVPFTVRSGNIYFVATGGNDSAAGSFAAPWATLVKARKTMVAGDTTYALNGVSQTTTDDYGADLSIQSAGTAASPIALVAYPGATVTVGSAAGQYYGLRTPAISGAKDYWVVAGLHLLGTAAIDLVNVTGWRVVGNDFSCPGGSGQSACFHTDTTTNLSFYGNYVHNVGDAAGSIDKYYHAVYFTTNSNQIDVGWNTVVPNPNGSTSSGGCRAIQFYSTGGSDQFDLHVHDNLVHDAICDGINFSTVNPDAGVVEAYNNVVYHVGTGPDPYNGSSNYACIVVGTSSTRSTAANVYNNTLVDCGPHGGSDSGALAIGTKTTLRNNIIRLNTGESYLASSWQPSCSTVNGSNNLWYGVGAPTSCTSGNVVADSLFVNLGGHDYHLQSQSPAIDAGTAVAGLSRDADGISRPQGAAYDIGAYEAASGSSSPAPPPPAANACDLNGDGVVNNLDVQIAVNQATGAAACNSADLQHSGTCSVVDVQRVVNASLGQACRTGL